MGSLSAKQLKALHGAIVDGLRYSLTEERPDGDDDIRYVEEGGPNPFWVYGREGERCRRKDRTPIVRIIQGGRSTYYCPYCQKL